MRYEILGPLRLAGGEGTSYIGARKVETLLAALLIRSDQVVAGGRLKEEIWGGSPPKRASAAMHVYVSQLRKILAAARGTDGGPIVTRPPGYMIQLGPDDELDVHAFEARVRQGRTHIQDGRHEAACVSLKSALAMWRGPALVGVSGGPMIGAFVAYLEDARVECFEMLMDAQLTMGRHRELVGQLQALITEYPLSEVFYRQLMLALYRSERQAEALKVYESARRVLHDELGLEPGQPLRDLQRSILLADPRLEPQSAGPATALDGFGRDLDAVGAPGA
ncbi:AfsR/SARP family transcriptional regulator [Streptomyces litchfieldiae]|uniref:AfsR/SARP family transcriptional regulator n=1 Tax=Streptomyces litchfieldiae TaxID=3075543 RepID=A0ABU2MYC7_9ACTN|nr:AfsR/SARP family transcriptional regulator [Streptomyces sp. DSM 44938]MDT0346652.1 AfsR/SARP family transcriptional regulator [Streptomyces sp. DSM 44938]